MAWTTNLLSEKINYFKNEIRNLKTAHTKTATAIATTWTTDLITIRLKLYGDPMVYQEVIGSKKAVIRLTSEDSTNMVSAAYLFNMSPGDLKDRHIFIRRRAANRGEAVFEVSVYSQNADDYNWLSGGAGRYIDVDYVIMSVGSSKFSTSVSYEDYNPWA